MQSALRIWATRGCLGLTQSSSGLLSLPGADVPDGLGVVLIKAIRALSIAKGLIDGYIDVGCFLANSEAAADVSDLIVNEREEPLLWVRSKDFVLSPGAPIPLVNWPDDNRMIRALTKNGSAYKIAFNSPDYHATVTALETGIGLAACLSRFIPTPLVQAKEYYLPPLPPTKTLLCARRELDNIQAQKLLRRLNESMFTSAKTDAA
jgi:hypothetical protein